MRPIRGVRKDGAFNPIIAYKDRRPPLSDMRLGIDQLLRRPERLRGRVGLIAHPASIDGEGRHVANGLRERLGCRLAALFGPEHGYFGAAGAGVTVDDREHPAWGIPIYSLYAHSRKPTREMLAEIDTLVFDLQDISVRCYTFVATLRFVLEACAEHGVRLVVCDRPVPLAHAVDGPFVVPGCESFVGAVPFPFVYGMTPGETARCLKDLLKLKVDLHVMPLTAGRACEPPPRWVSPSPGIRYWHTGWTYPITVFTEALPALSCGRGGPMPFELLAAPWMDAEKTAGIVNRLGLKGVVAEPVWTPLPGIRLVVRRAEQLEPFSAAVQIFCALRDLYGQATLWTAEGTRPEWFDKLAGTPSIREGLQCGAKAEEILASLKPSLRAFRCLRAKYLLYPR